MKAEAWLQAARACGKAVEALEELQAILTREAIGEPLPTPDTPPAAQNGAQEPQDVPGLCGCTLHTRCDLHEAQRPKGCDCNGPFYSSTCAHPKHRDAATKWPAGDPATVE